MRCNKVGFIRRDDRKYEGTYEKFKRKIRKMFLKVKVEKVQNDIMILLPKYIRYGYLFRKIIVFQINRILRRKNIEELVFEQELEFMKKDFKQYYQSNGKLMMKNNIIKIFKYIFNINNSNLSLENAYILVNEYNKQNLYIINELIDAFKTVNIVTENLKNYKRLENKLFEDGVLITVTNNKRKSLKNARYIINIDFDKNKILMYNINSKSVIINLYDKEIVLKNDFSGVLINNMVIKLNDNQEQFIDEFYGNISRNIFLELLLKKNIEKLEYIKKINTEFGVKISGLIGIRGRLENNEFLGLRY